MTTIRATCGECGDVVLTTGDMKVLRCTSDGTASYAFRCPGCQLQVVKPARGRTMDLLVSSGVVLQEWDLPAELAEPRYQGRPISHDELLDFHCFLVDDDRFTAALSALADSCH